MDDLIPRVRLLRFLVGAIGSLVGLAAIFVVGMAYRTLADSRLGGALVVVALLAGALALGGIMTAMLLGHWYLNTPTASGKPLEFSTTLTLVALAIAFVCALLLGPSTLKLHDPGVALSPGTTIIDKGSGGIVITTPTPQPTGTTGQQPTRGPPGATGYQRVCVASIPHGIRGAAGPGVSGPATDARALVPVGDGHALSLRRLHLHRRDPWTGSPAHAAILSGVSI